MNKILIIYYSKSGFTKYYAELLARTLNCKAVTLAEAREELNDHYSTVIFGSRLKAGHLDKLNKAVDLIKEFNIKNIIIFATGASPVLPDNPEGTWRTALGKNIQYPHFYFPGGLNYEALGPIDTFMMKVFSTVVGITAGKSEESQEMARMIKSSYDATSEDAVQPLVTYLKEKNLI